MKKILFPVLIFGILLTMSNCNNEEEQEDPSTYTLVGTWEAEGEFIDNTWSFKCTLVFLNEADFEQDTVYIKKQDGQIVTEKDKGTYTCDENKIIYIDVEKGSAKCVCSYRFINKNTLETFGIGFTSEQLAKMTFTRKN
jgi:hypothetical protein